MPSRGSESVPCAILFCGRRSAPHDPDARDWSWHDARLARLQRHGIVPIVGLLHHGSGPRYTSLLDPALPRLLEDYAGSVARRFPWLRDVTPVNEPLTTARFSGLYGHWYPHLRSEAAFLRMVVNQCKADPPRHAGDPPGDPGCPPRPDRGYRADLQHARPRQPGRPTRTSDAGSASISSAGGSIVPIPGFDASSIMASRWTIWPFSARGKVRPTSSV